MVSMRSQRKMPAFSSNFMGDKIFRKVKVYADFQANRQKSLRNCVFYLKRSHGSLFSYFDPIMFEKRSDA